MPSPKEPYVVFISRYGESSSLRNKKHHDQEQHVTRFIHIHKYSFSGMSCLRFDPKLVKARARAPRCAALPMRTSRC